MIRYLIWDAGGTLFDTYPAVVAACERALATYGHHAPPDWLLKLFRQTKAYALKTTAATYELDVEALTLRFESAYSTIEPELQPPFPFVKRVCAYVVEAGGANYAVTHRARASLVALLTAHELALLFSDCITEDDPYPRKPDPASILALLNRHNLVSDTCLAIGDRDIDVVAGRRAGVMTCFYGTDTHETRADLEITRYSELLAWLQSQRGRAREG